MCKLVFVVFLKLRSTLVIFRYVAVPELGGGFDLLLLELAREDDSGDVVAARGPNPGEHLPLEPQLRLLLVLWDRALLPNVDVLGPKI